MAVSKEIEKNKKKSKENARNYNSNKTVIGLNAFNRLISIFKIFEERASDLER